MLVSEQARVFQVRGLRFSKEPTVLGLSPVRLGNRTYRAWRTTKLTPMVLFLTAPTGPGHSARKFFLKLTCMVLFLTTPMFIRIRLHNILKSALPLHYNINTEIV